MAPNAARTVPAEKPELVPACSDAYGEAELDVVLRRGDWRSWHQAIEWLKSDGMDDSELSQACAMSLLDDLEALDRDNVAFTSDPYLALLLVRSHR